MKPRLALVALLAFVATLFSPVRTSWACPDGTACVAHGQKYVCAGGHCGSHASCCVTSQPCVCKHGALPGTTQPHSSTSAVEAPDHCQFHVTAPPHLVAASAGTYTLHLAHPPALLVTVAPELVEPAVGPTWAGEYTLGYRPPPIHRQGPSRAPPTL